MDSQYIQGVIKQFEYYKNLGDNTFDQLSPSDLFWKYNKESNSIAIIVSHLCGNMLSRWTDFLQTDGEKSWRDRDSEFEPTIKDKQTLLVKWEEGWNCLLSTLKNLTNEDLEKTIYIRNQGHTVIEAINRQLAHYPYHIGQIVFIGKMLANDSWKSLSIAKGNSQSYNDFKFSQQKQKSHYTDEYLNKK